MDPSFMYLAIEEAGKSSEPYKCGCVIVHDGKVIAQAHSSQRAERNASAHAEINALRIAGAAMDNKYLEDCDAYCTCEPCLMCVTAMLFAHIRTIHYGVSLQDAFPNGPHIDISLAEFLKRAPRTIKIVPHVLEEECRKVNMD